MIDVILSGTRDQFSALERSPQDFDMLQRQWTQRVDSQADYVVERIIRSKWQEPPPGHPFEEKELCDVLATICQAVLGSVGLNVIGNRLFSFLCDKTPTLKQQSVVWAHLESVFGVYGEGFTIALGARARNDESPQPRPGWMPSVSAMDPVTCESHLKGIWEAKTSADKFSECWDNFHHYINLPITDFERGCVERAKRQELLRPHKCTDTQNPEERISRVIELTGSAIAWSYVLDYLKWKKDRTQTVHVIRRPALDRGMQMFRQMIPCRNRSDGEQLLSFAGRLDKVRRTCSHGQ
jgi:hypothetical protein